LADFYACLSAVPLRSRFSVPSVLPVSSFFWHRFGCGSHLCLSIRFFTLLSFSFLLQVLFTVLLAFFFPVCVLIWFPAIAHPLPCPDSAKLMFRRSLLWQMHFRFTSDSKISDQRSIVFDLLHKLSRCVTTKQFSDCIPYFSSPRGIVTICIATVAVHVDFFAVVVIILACFENFFNRCFLQIATFYVNHRLFHSVMTIFRFAPVRLLIHPPVRKV